MKILAINTPCHNVTYSHLDNIHLNSKQLFSDYDIIIINLENISRHHVRQYNNFYNLNAGKNGETNTRSKIEDFLNKDNNHIKNEILNSLYLGKNIYIFTDLDCSTVPSQTDFTIANFQFLPFFPPCTPGKAKDYKIVKKTKYHSLLQEITEYLEVSGYFPLPFKGATPLLQLANDQRIVGQAISINDLPGKLIFLPAIKKSISQNLSSLRHTLPILLDSIVAFEKEQRTNDEELTVPTWTSVYQLAQEKISLEKLKELQAEQERITQQITLEQAKVQERQEYKILFAGTGKPLEAITSKLLKNLGFTFEETEENRTDLIAKYGEKAFVIEIKGLTKSAGEKNSAQLEKWASEYLEHHGSVAKPILIVNAYKDTPLDKRTEPAFPNQMIPYATKRDHCLVTGLQLLGMYLDIEAHPKKKDAILEYFFATIGVYQHYSDYRDFLEVIDEEQN